MWLPLKAWILRVTVAASDSMAFGGTCSFSPIQWWLREVPGATLSVVEAITSTSLLDTVGTTQKGEKESELMFT